MGWKRGLPNSSEHWHEERTRPSGMSGTYLADSYFLLYFLAQIICSFAGFSRLPFFKLLLTTRRSDLTVIRSHYFTIYVYQFPDFDIVHCLQHENLAIGLRFCYFRNIVDRAQTTGTNETPVRLSLRGLAKYYLQGSEALMLIFLWQVWLGCCNCICFSTEVWSYR
jgi:hypothetical protein